MGNVGVKVSMPGIDVERANDNQLLFSSSFAGMKIMKSGFWKMEKAMFPVEEKIIDYDSGYYPAFMIFRSFYEDATSTIFDQTIPYFNQADFTFIIKRDGIYASTGFAKQGEFYYYIFDIDLEENIPPLFVKKGDDDAKIRESSYGIRVSKSGKSALSLGAEDMALTSSAKNFIVHQVNNYEIPGTGTYTTKHDLGYKPMALIYNRFAGTDGYRPYRDYGSVSVKTDIYNDRIENYYDTGVINVDKETVIVFKDLVS